MSSTTDDPRAAARAKFNDSPVWSGLELLARCATDPPLAIGTLLDAVKPARAGEHRICELGFGDGWLLDEITRAHPRAFLIGLDQSPAYVRRARNRFQTPVAIVRGDMEALPFAERSLDVIVTCWTFYFMGDIDAALDGMKRCLRAGGRLVAATVAPDHMREHEEMAAEAMRASLGRDPEPDIGLRFDTESGEPYMRRHFAQVELRDWRGELVLPDMATALELWDSYPPAGLSEDEEAAAREAYRGIAEARLHAGAISVRRHDGAFVGSAG